MCNTTISKKNTSVQPSISLDFPFTKERIGVSKKYYYKGKLSREEVQIKGPHGIKDSSVFKDFPTVVDIQLVARIYQTINYQGNSSKLSLIFIDEPYFAIKRYLPSISLFGLTITPALSAKQPIHINNIRKVFKN